ncbi:MAG: HAMP domain-containing sensor histidine kinase [Planctomycetota bacterium]
MRRAGRATHWAIYALASLLVVHGLGWITWQALRLERAQATARAVEARRDAERIALWRMDSLASALVARETQRPYFEYRAFVAPGRAYERLWGEPRAGEAVRPGRLLLGDPAPEPLTGVAVLHYVVSPTGAITSPQAPSDELLASAGVPAVDSARVDEASARLDALRSMLRSAGELVERVERGGEAEIEAASGENEGEGEREFAFRRQFADIANRAQQEPASDGPRGDGERAAGSPRALASAGRATETARGTTADESVGLQDAAAFAETSSSAAFDDAAPGVSVGVFVARWIGPDALALEREAVIEGEAWTQGVWLDWPRLRDVLGGAARGVLPGADVSPAPTGARGDAMLLASLPIRLAAPGVDEGVSLGMTPVRWSLLLTWAAVLTAVVAVGVVLRQAVTLSERRGRFVSAVTHELRTPLTTFQLYSQMLADGMVSDESVRAGYLATLKSESARLAGIVENVLEYARLSRRSGPRETSAISPGELLARLRPVLSRRAEQGDMDLVVHDGLDPGETRRVRGDLDAIERILVNLVDNACKYAGAGAGASAGGGDHEGDPRVHLVLSVEAGDRLGLMVADHGPGIGPEDRERVFGEFRRGERGSRADRGGLGLGLALSRGLAREMGGDLRVVDRRGHGAEVLLTLPLVAGGAIGLGTGLGSGLGSGLGTGEAGHGR